MNRYEARFLLWSGTWGATLALAVLLVLALAGCMAGLAKPETISQKIAYTEAGLTATYNTIRDLKAEGRISAATRDDLVGKADTAGRALDAARTALGSGDTSTALGK